MRKRILLASFISLFGFICAFAQHKIVITLSSGDTIEKNIWEVKSITFGDVEPISVTQPDENTAVDLGLSVKWSSFNLGASSSEQRGSLIGWGDITGKNTSTDLTYFPTFYVENDIVNTSYDIAKTLWGDKWRLPSAKEIQELIDSCTWTAQKDDVGNLKGYTVTAKNNNSIFLPVTSQRVGSNIPDSLYIGNYWSGSMATRDNEKATFLTMYVKDDGKDSISLSESMRYMGFAIRPVYGSYNPGIKVQVSDASAVDQTSAHIILLYSGDVANITEVGIRYAKSEQELTDGYQTVSVSKGEFDANSGQHSFDLTNLTYSTKYYYQGYAIINGKDSLSEVLNFTTEKKYTVEWVDLGLPSGLKWSKYNLGATNENEYGKYFLWADAKEQYSSQSNYGWPVYDDPSNIAGTEYDVATYVLGSEAHIPNGFDFIELREKCDWTSVSSPIKGWKVTGPNGNSIFFPYNGNIQADGTTSYYKGVNAFYWTSETYDKLNANYYTFSSSAKLSGKIQYTGKYMGMGIRPVSGTSNTKDPTLPDVVVNPSDYDDTAVDLGLSVYWASCNLGAADKSATSLGDRYAWGETSTKSTFSRNDYEFYSGGTYTSMPVSDIAGTDYDAVHKIWGGDWKMPSETELLELMTECNWTWTTQDGVQGYKITSKNSSYTGSIFLPATEEDGSGSYWSSILYTLEGAFYNTSSYYMEFSSKYVPSGCTYYYRYLGKYIRPVKIKR